MEITVIFLFILIKFYRWSTKKNIKAEYVSWSMCLLKSVAKFKDAISLAASKDIANGFQKMLSLCSSFRREIELLLEAQLKNPKNLISGDIM